MKILFTGGSSFTGFWFIRELAAAGHNVTAVFRKQAEEYSDVTRRHRVALASATSRPVYGCSFGDERFLALISEGGWDLLCHHAADVTELQESRTSTPSRPCEITPTICRLCLMPSGCRLPPIASDRQRFEGGEGAGSQGLPDFSPYGLSKALTAEMFAYYCERAGVGLGKFVIPNPFGPFEEPRFTAYLMKTG